VAKGLAIVGLKRLCDAALRNGAFSVRKCVGRAGAVRHSGAHHAVCEAERQGPFAQLTTRAAKREPSVGRIGVGMKRDSISCASLSSSRPPRCARAS
jgi:hypothetical protein